jgi:hypothetical protein
MAVLSHLALLPLRYLFVSSRVPDYVMPSPSTPRRRCSPSAGGYSWWTNTAVTATEIFGGTPWRSSSRLLARLHLVEAARGAGDASARQPQHDPDSRSAR